jgi:hypothetical protein
MDYIRNDNRFPSLFGFQFESPDRDFVRILQPENETFRTRVSFVLARGIHSTRAKRPKMFPLCPKSQWVAGAGLSGRERLLRQIRRGHHNTEEKMLLPELRQDRRKVRNDQETEQ